MLILFFLVFAIPVSAQVPQAELSWEVVVPGIEFTKYRLPDPVIIYVVRMDRSNSALTIESSIAQGKLSEGRETVSSMYKRYNQAINYWGGSANPSTWGLRNQVAVAINGSYFDWGTGVPQGGQVQSGWYAKRYDNFGGWSGFAWKLDRSAFIGECVYHFPDRQIISFPATGNNQQINKINTAREMNDLVLYTPQYNSRTGTENAGVEVTVEMLRPAMILPSPSYASGIIRQIAIGSGNNLIPFNSIVLSASGSAAQTLLGNVQVGDEIRVSQEISSYDYDCTTPNPLSWTKTYASIQGAFFFLNNGMIRDFNDPGATERNPRTAIAYNDQYVYFIVVDGRDIHLSIGMTIHDLALFTRDILGANSGVAQDGGGSSTLVINGKVVNNTFCNIYSCAGQYVVYLPAITSNYEVGAPTLAREHDIIFSDAGVERAVANGMLMVVVQPDEYSTTFSRGDLVTTVSETLMRLGPGTNYASFRTITTGATGTILSQTNNLNGIRAKWNYWWFVSIDGTNGWVPQSALAKK